MTLEIAAGDNSTDTDDDFSTLPAEEDVVVAGSAGHAGVLPQGNKVNFDQDGAGLPERSLTSAYQSFRYTLQLYDTPRLGFGSTPDLATYAKNRPLSNQDEILLRGASTIRPWHKINQPGGPDDDSVEQELKVLHFDSVPGSTALTPDHGDTATLSSGTGSRPRQSEETLEEQSLRLYIGKLPLLKHMVHGCFPFFWFFFTSERNKFFWL